MKNKKSHGFTLSETLIALTIVGIIAALTIPGVVSRHQRNTYITALKKSYVDLQEALTLMQANNYRATRLSISEFMSPETFLSNYYKGANCPESGCFAKSYGSIEGNNEESFSCEYESSINTEELFNLWGLNIFKATPVGNEITVTGNMKLLPNSAAVCVIPPKTHIVDSYKRIIDLGFIKTEKTEKLDDDKVIKRNYPAKIYIDINGAKEPNIGGRDMFALTVNEDFSIDDLNKDANCLTSPTGEGCFNKILNDNWNMTY